MKRFIAAACLLGMLSTTALAQGLYVGPVVGYTSSQTSISVDDESLDVEGGSGPALGGFVGYSINPMLSVETGLIYGGQSFEFSTFVAPASSNNEEPDSEIKLNYINVPLIVMAQFPEEGNIRGRLRGGLQFGFETGCKISGTAAGTGQSGEEIDCSDSSAATKSTDLGLPLAAGVGIGLGDSGNMTLFFDLGYKIGLTNIAEGGNDVSIKNNAVSAMAGLAIGLGD